MTQMLASARNYDEASVLLNSHVDIIDLKEPSLGALGALSLEEVREIVDMVEGQTIVSATIGDLPMTPSLIVQNAYRMADTGVDIVKVGFFGTEGLQACLDALAEPNKAGMKTVAVLMADMPYPKQNFEVFKEAGFYGVMLDTADKKNGRLTEIIPQDTLLNFVKDVQKHGLAVGLAGSLTVDDARALRVLNPDYLGFRSAICRMGSRVNELDAWRVNQLTQLLCKNNMSKTRANVD